MENGTYPSPFAGPYPQLLHTYGLTYHTGTLRLIRYPCLLAPNRTAAMESVNIPNRQCLEDSEWTGTCRTVLAVQISE